jgi:phage tail P2-like protein
MKYVRSIDHPKTDDTVGFLLETYNDDGLLKNPYTLEQIYIYRIERRTTGNDRFIEFKKWHPEIENEHAALASQQNADTSRLLKLKKTATDNKISYSEAKIVLETTNPLWQREGKSLVFNITDDNKKEIEGKFLFLWQPKGMREGSYLIQWHWKNTKNGKLNSAQKLFTLYPALEKINSIYRNFVPRQKYNFLFDKYIPPMYRTQTTMTDITPEVLVKFNKSIAQFLLELDDLAVGLIDLISPTFIPEGFLPALANFFNLQLRSDNVAAWRNQIKHAMLLYKKKGTKQGLSEALDQAGIKLLKLTNLWQVISPCTWTDGFVINADMQQGTTLGHLSRKPVDKTIEVSIKSVETDEYFILPNNIISLQEMSIPEPQIAVIWLGDSHSEPINLFKGDVVRVKYKYNKMPESLKEIENYIQTLPLADQRDETKVKYPLKNWNVKLIEEDDPLFDLLIPERHSFHNPVTFGKIRTTFLYSEKAFNMDTYNGSLYNSNNPCDMDKDFVDPCSGGQSSKFNVHLEFDQASDEKIEEAKEIIEDYSPFHAVLHNMKISSKTTEFIIPPTEKVKSKVKNKNSNISENVSCSEAIYCQIKYKDGKVEHGRLI